MICCHNANAPCLRQAKLRSSFGVLFDDCRESFFWWHCVQFLHNWCLAILVALNPNPDLALFCMAMLDLALITFIYIRQPFTSVGDNRAAVTFGLVAAMQSIVLLVAAMLLTLPIPGVDLPEWMNVPPPEEQNATATVIFAVVPFVWLMAFTFFKPVLACYRLRSRCREMLTTGRKDGETETNSSSRTNTDEAMRRKALDHTRFPKPSWTGGDAQDEWDEKASGSLGQTNFGSPPFGGPPLVRMASLLRFPAIASPLLSDSKSLVQVRVNTSGIYRSESFDPEWSPRDLSHKATFKMKEAEKSPTDFANKLKEANKLKKEEAKANKKGDSRKNSISVDDSSIKKANMTMDSNNKNGNHFELGKVGMKAFEFKRNESGKHRSPKETNKERGSLVVMVETKRNKSKSKSLVAIESVEPTIDDEPDG
jgi:hypothetical protein